MHRPRCGGRPRRTPLTGANDAVGSDSPEGLRHRSGRSRDDCDARWRRPAIGSGRGPADQTVGPMTPIWAFFGYDEPNYTYMKDGRKLLSELAALSPVPVYVRAHNLLTTGDGTPALKWGSTNAYTEDADGRPRYDWTIVDRILDTYVERKMKPLVEIGFMPRGALVASGAVPPSTGSPARPTTTSTPAGPIRRPTTPSGASWFTSWAAHSSRSTAGRRSTAGIGRCGTSRTSATGREHRRSTRSSTTSRRTV